MLKNKSIFVFIFLICTQITQATSIEPSKHTKHKKPKQETQLSKDQEIKVREEMVHIAKQLGVTCTYCHKTEQFRDSSLKTYQTAKEHIRITELLNSKEAFNSKPKVSCYTCHQGKAKFEYEMKKDSGF